MICDDAFNLQHPLSFTLWNLCMISWLRSTNSIIYYQGPVFSVEILYSLSACLTKRYYTSPCVTVRLLHVCGCDKQPYPFFIRHRDHHCRPTSCTHTLIPTPQLSDSRGGSRVLCWRLAVSVICEDCFIILKRRTVTDFAGRLCRFPPVSRRKGSMTSQSGIQWVMFALCHPLPARLPLSDKPLSCPTIALVQRLYLDASLLSGPSAIFHAVIETLTVPWEVCWDPVQCAVFIFLLVLWLWWLMCLFSSCQMLNG